MDYQQEIKQGTTATEVPESFTKLTDSYKLTAKLTGTSLKITLEDYVMWTIYESQYTQQDIGNEIHKKVDLADIYSSLTLNGVSQGGDSDENKMMEMQKENKKQSEFKFGEVVSLAGIPCYKIEKYGKLTVYVDHYDRRTKKSETYESYMCLKNTKTLTEIQILMFKYEKSKKAGEKDKILNTNEFEQQKLIQLLKNQQMQLVQTKKQLKDLKNQKKSQANQELIQLKLKLNQASLKQKMNLPIFDLSLQTIASSIKIGINQFNSRQFMINENIIKYVGNNKTYTQYLLHSLIPLGLVYKFSVRILHCQAGNLAIGVVDYKQRSQERTSFNINSDSVFYKNSTVYRGNQQNPQISQSYIFLQGQTVEVSVSLSQETIIWSIKGKQIGATKFNRLALKSCQYVPAIEFYNKGDIIQFIDEKIVPIPTISLFGR